MFSSASRFSNPISQAIPRGRPGEGSRESFTMGMRACGSGLTWNLVSEKDIHQYVLWRSRQRPIHEPRSRRSPSIVTRSVAERRSSESIRQHRSMSATLGQLLHSGQQSWANRPELRRLKPFAVLPKDSRRLSGSIVRMRRSRSLRTFSLTAISSPVGNNSITKSKRHWERSAKNRCRLGSLR